jgi:NADH oxidase (H2O-forming)
MFTWMASTKTLFTCDFLGAHFCEPTMMDTNIHYEDKYFGEFQYYYKGIFSPFKPYVLAGLDKIKDLPVAMICPSHGPCLTENIEKCKEFYREWSTPIKHEKKMIGILFASAYGCTAKLARAAFDELEKNDRLDVRLVDMVFAPFDQVAELANEADALLVGSCTINRDAPKIVWDTLASIDAINTKQKPAGAFGSYGWSGEAVPMMKSRLENLKYKFIGEGLKVTFMPTDEDLAAMGAYANEIVSNIKE